MNGNGKYPTLEQFKAHVVNKLGEVEVIRQSLYDTLVYPTAGAVVLPFFQNPIGQGLSASPGNAGNAKAQTDTNLTLGGQLPAPQAFYIQSIEVDFQPGSSANANTFALLPPVASGAVAATFDAAGENDVSAFYTGGSLTLTIGTKPYLNEAPLLRFPPKARFEMDSSVASQAAVADVIVTKGKLKSGGRPYQLDPGLGLMTSQNFNVTLAWPVAVATPSGFNGAVRVILDGWLFRAVQ